jgi:hypothetical protein
MIYSIFWALAMDLSEQIVDVDTLKQTIKNEK